MRSFCGRAWVRKKGSAVDPFLCAHHLPTTQTERVGLSRRGVALGHILFLVRDACPAHRAVVHSCEVWAGKNNWWLRVTLRYL